VAVGHVTEARPGGIGLDLVLRPTHYLTWLKAHAVQAAAVRVDAKVASLARACTISSVRWIWSPLWSLQVQNPRWKRRKWLRVVARRAAEDLHDHPRSRSVPQVRDPGAGELTAEDHAVPPVGLRNVSSKSGVATATWWTPSRF
jgi:hypothetical protein